MYVDEMERDSNGQLLADTYPSASGCATACAKPRDFLPRATGADPLPPLSLQEAVIQRLNSPNPCGFICTVGWSVGLDIALTFLDLQKAIAHIVR